MQHGAEGTHRLAFSVQSLDVSLSLPSSFVTEPDTVQRNRNAAWGPLEGPKPRGTA